MRYELLIRNATVIDGTRAPRFEADIGVHAGRISAIGKLVGTANHGRSAETLPLIERAMRAQKIGLDCYPYCAPRRC